MVTLVSSDSVCIGGTIECALASYGGFIKQECGNMNSGQFLKHWDQAVHSRQYVHCEMVDFV